MYARLAEDMDVNAGRVLEGTATLEEVGQEIFDKVLDLASGETSKSEELGHREFVLTYKSFEPLGPACLPA
jgi:altronate hydrolase